ALRHGATIQTATRAVALRTGPDGRVVGVSAESDDGRIEFSARRGVVLATGGFEWDKQLVDQFLGVPMVAPASPPANAGDGLRMSQAVGAALGNMTEAWWGPMVYAEGDTY